MSLELFFVDLPSAGVSALATTSASFIGLQLLQFANIINERISSKNPDFLLFVYFWYVCDAGDTAQGPARARQMLYS